MIAQWISTSALGVYPPMSRWVYALTFLRSTSQGVEADFLLPNWVVALMEFNPSASPVLPLS